MKQKLQQLIVELNKNLVGKEDVMKLSLLTMLAGENLILFGKPGTAKSEIARRLSKIFEEDSYFEYLLTKFTTPEEIFGPLSIQELKADRFRRNVDGYMPNVKVAFLDEIFKANSSILNSLLTIINEKIYHNGNEKIKVPLQSLISASNELPIGDRELSALYDRFLVRVVVNYLSDDDVNELFDVEDEEFNTSDSLKMKIEEIEKIKQEAKNVEIPEEIRTCIIEIRRNFNETFKEDKDEVFSDRKFVKIMKFLKVSAYTNGRKEVDLSDVYLLTNCLWNREDNSTKLSSIITKVVQSNVSINIDNASLIDKNYNKRDSKKTNFDFKGEGTEYSPFLIEDINDLMHINNSNYLNKGYYFEQTEDIDLSSIIKWISIGVDEKNPFSGHYNGNSFKILNLTGDSGLFGVINKDSLVRNISLEYIEIETKLRHVGGIVNTNYGLINSCYSTGSILSESLYIGGIVGFNSKGTILNSYNICDINLSNENISGVGGIVGKSDEGGILYCYNSGKISGKSYFIGGILGINSNGNISDCYNIGSFFPKKSCFLGGISGTNEKGKIENCYNSIDISSSDVLASPISIGGIVGTNDEGTINNCYNTGEVSLPRQSVNSTIGGVVGANNGTIQISYNKGNISNNCSNNDVGGVSGSNKGTIHDCYNEGSIFNTKSDKNDVGGISGSSKGNINNCYNIGNIFSSSNSGGIVSNNNGYINNCVAMNKEMESKRLGKIAIQSTKSNSIIKCFSNQEMLLNGKIDLYSKDKNIENFKLNLMNEKFFNRLGWNFNNIWTWDSAENRPILDLSTQKTTTKASNNKKATEISTSENDVNIFKENIWL